MFALLGQAPMFNIGGKTKNYTSGKVEEGVIVEIVQNGKTIESTTTSNNGTYDLKAQVDFSKEFFVVFKKSGFFSKKIQMDFTQLDIETAPAGEDITPYNKDHYLDMISITPNLDLSFLESEPVAIIYFDAQEYGPVNENTYSSKIEKKIQKLIEEAVEKNKGDDAAFQALFKEAENLYLTQKKYKDALAKYEEAINLKPTDEPTLARIDELDAIIKKLNEDELAANQADAAYIALKNEADALRDKGSYQQAIDKYNQALGLKDEQYPKDQIEYCEEQIENATKYETLITAADQFFNQKSYKTALSKYQEASKLKPNEQYPKDRITACNGFLDGQAAELEKKKQYDDLVAAADALYTDKNWKDAKAKYAEAYAFDDKSEYPNERIKLCDVELEKIAEAEAKQKKIEELLAAGLAFFNESKWQDAKLKYSEVIKEETTNTIAQQKLTEIEAKLNEEKSNQALMENFAKLEKEGDEADLASDFTLAKSKYEEALKIKEDTKVKQKLDAVNAKISDAAAKAKRIQDLLTEADNFYKSSSWLESKLKYQAVLKEDSKNQIAEAKIIELDEKIKQDLALQDANKLFTNLVSEGDKASSSNDLNNAESKYTEALKIKDDQGVKDKLASVKQKILEQNALDALNKEFNDLKQQAEQKEAKKDWSGAQKLYEDALLKKNDPIVVAKIEELKNKIKAEADVAALNASFETLKKEGFDLADQKKWSDAKMKLEDAKKIKEDPLVTAKLVLIDQEIAKGNSLLENENNFLKLSSEALVLEQNKDYKNAIDKYTQALNFKPNDAQTKAKIEQLKLEQQKIEDQLAIDKSYQDFLSQGKKLMTEKKYAEAIQKFNEANKLKPSEKEPVDLAAEAEKLEKLANSDADIQFNNIIQAAENKITEKDATQARDYASRAQKLRPNDKRITDLLAKIEALEKLQKTYTDKMAEAEKLVVEKKYDDAIKSFQAAKDLKYDEIAPQNRIDEVSKLKLDTSAKNEIDKQYAAFMKSGFDKFTSKDYNGALADYLSALNVKTNDQPAMDKVAEIEQILDDLNKQLQAQNNLKSQVEKIKQEADAFFKSANYDNAISKYNELIKLEESTYARMQIAESMRLKSELDAKNMNNQLYAGHVKNGDDYFTLKNYDKAKESYQNALKIMANETYPKEKIKAIEDLQAKNLTGKKLEDLGDPFFNSAMDGYALVAKTEILENMYNVQGMEEIQNSIDVNNKKISEENQTNTLENVQRITEIESNIKKNEGSIDANQNRSVLLLAQIENDLKINEVERNNESSETSLTNVRSLTEMNTNYQKLTIKSDEINNENQIKLSAIEEDIAILKAKQLKAATETSLANTTSINEFTDNKVILEAKNNDKVNENVKQLDNLQLSLKVADNKQSDENSNAILDAQIALVKVENNIKDKNLEAAKLQLDNAKQMDDLSHGLAVKATENNQNQIDQQLNAAGSIEKINTTLKSKEKDIDENQQDATLQMSNLSSNIAVNQKEQNANNSSEILNRAAQLKNIETQIKINDAKVEGEGSENAVKVLALEDEIQLSQKKEQDNIQANQSNAISSLSELETQIAVKNNNASAAAQSDVNVMDELKTSLSVQQKAQEQSSQNSSMNNMIAMENISKPKQETENVGPPNEVGQAYPEGVTEEYFTRKNSRGDVTAFITRRIVVNNGHGDVYVKTRANSMTTYTKNGTAITEISYEQQSNGDGQEKFIRTE